jgi:(p)ppGpp synthase/HD superfamily hydrolase
VSTGSSELGSLRGLLEALYFAASKHRDQRRKGSERSPYVNHLVEVAHLLVGVGGIDDVETLQAAALHDVVEDTPTSPEEIEARFGAVVRRIVEEVSDDKTLPQSERKRLQVEKAPNLSRQAQVIKIADKISNVRAIIALPPEDWTLARRIDYVDWAEQVVAGCRGINAPLEALHAQTVELGRRVLQQAAGG